MATIRDGETVGVMDVGGSHVTGALVTLRNGLPAIEARAEGLLDSRADRATVLRQLCAPATELVDYAVNARYDWAVAMPGPFDDERGQGNFEGVEKFASIAGVNLRSEFGAAFGVGEDRIGFVNDAVAYSLGEWSQAAVRPDRFVCLTLGTGVGSAFLDHGQPVVDGPTVPPHGWAHLLSYDDHPLEQTVSSRAIVADYRRLGGDDAAVRQIADRARGGEVVAAAVLASAMHALGRTLAPWLVSFDADELVVGGAISQAWDLLEDALRSGIADGDPQPATRLRLRPSTLLSNAPLLGAAHWLSRRPSRSPAPKP